MGAGSLDQLHESRAVTVLAQGGRAAPARAAAAPAGGGERLGEVVRGMVGVWYFSKSKYSRDVILTALGSSIGLDLCQSVFRYPKYCES